MRLMKVDFMVLVGHQENLIYRYFHLSAANFQMNLIVGSRAHFQTAEIEIDCELMNENT
jgi:hypothetical protein